MLPIPPTTMAVADAVSYYRELRCLTRDELAYLLSLNGHDLQSDQIARVERSERAVSVDDLVALAYALEVTPAALLSHPPADLEGIEGEPIATGLPADLSPGELADWLEGRTGLDDDSRARWWDEQATRLEILSIHLEDQLAAAFEELREIDRGTEQGIDSTAVEELMSRVRTGELLVYETSQERDVVAMRLDALRGPQ